MKKGILILAIMLVGLIKVNASTWQQGLVNWQDSQGNTLPQYYGQYLEFNYNTNYTEKFYKIENGITPPNGAKGVLFSVTFRQFQFQQYLECIQYQSSSGICDIYTFNGHQNISFSMSYNNGNSVFNCYWYDNTFTTTLDSNYVRGLLYCPLGTTTGKITRINYMGNVSRQANLSASDYPTYSIGLEKTILFDIDDTSSIINNQNNNTQAILDKNTTYQDTPSEDINGTTIDNYEQAEQNLLNSLDMNMTLLDGITINPNASTFIWNTADRLRNINPGIILLITSILGMGIIKMVLNR